MSTSGTKQHPGKAVVQIAVPCSVIYGRNDDKVEAKVGKVRMRVDLKYGEAPLMGWKQPLLLLLFCAAGNLPATPFIGIIGTETPSSASKGFGMAFEMLVK